MPLMSCILGLFAFGKKKRLRATCAEILCSSSLPAKPASRAHARTRTHARGLTKAWEESDEGLC